MIARGHLRLVPPLPEPKRRKCNRRPAHWPTKRDGDVDAFLARAKRMPKWIATPDVARALLGFLEARADGIRSRHIDDQAVRALSAWRKETMRGYYAEASHDVVRGVLWAMTAMYRTGPRAS